MIHPPGPTLKRPRIGHPTQTARRLVEASVSPNTSRGYAGALRRLDAWLADRPLHDVTLAASLAPFEQHTSERTQGPPTDIYALAAVSCRVLTGEPPPNATDRMLGDCYEPLAERVVGAPSGWLAAIYNGLAVRPEDRPQTVTAWRAALNETGSQPLGAAEIEKLREAASQNDPQRQRGGG